MLSVLITTYNEEDNITACLKSVAWATERFVVDSMSSDNTVALAKAQGATVIQRKYTGPADQKNWAIPQLAYEWVLILDADERCSEALQAEITEIITQNPPFDGYWIPRENFFMGQKIRFSGWQNDRVIRLIRRDRCLYNTKQVHEEIETTGVQIATLVAALQHFTFKNTTHFIEKQQRYALWSAQDHALKTSKIGYFHLCTKPFFRFFKHFILKKGFLDGKVGFVISALMAWSVFLRYVHLLEKHRTSS
jgi:glycosyltransferase involved in cell wall biosynthesis